MKETQESISQWATETFGPPSSLLRVATRANEEMAELLKCLSQDENHPKAAEEAADVAIVLCRLADRLEVKLTFGHYYGWVTRPLMEQAIIANNALASVIDHIFSERNDVAGFFLQECITACAGIPGARSWLEREIDRKMKTNRARTWNLTGDGHGYHIKEGAE